MRSYYEQSRQSQSEEVQRLTTRSAKPHNFYGSFFLELKFKLAENIDMLRRKRKTSFGSWMFQLSYDDLIIFLSRLHSKSVRSYQKDFADSYVGL